MIFFLLIWPFGLWARLELVPPEKIAAVFAGENRRLELVWRNPADQEIAVELRMQLLQASSSVAMPVSDQPWKILRLLARQTAIESAEIDFPAVTSRTRFLVQWGDESTVYGTSEVLVYPAGPPPLLAPATRGKRIAVFDPQNRLKTLLGAAQVGFEELGPDDWKKFSGDLAIIGLISNSGSPASMMPPVSALLQRGVSVLWFGPPALHPPAPETTAYALRLNDALFVAIPARDYLRLASDPAAQERFADFTRLALHPDRFPFAHLIP
jgi:hypothetical protein